MFGKGATIHTLVEGARYFLLADNAPDEDEAKRAAQQLLSQQSKQIHLKTSHHATYILCY